MSDDQRRSILTAVSEGRAVHANESGPALSREEFGMACSMALGEDPLTRAIRRDGTGPPRLELTDTGRRVLESLKKD